MAVVSPIPKDSAPEDVKGIYDDLAEKFGRVPNIFGMMAHHPPALKAFLPFYGAVMQEGSVDLKYKELAYLKAAQINGCEY